MVKISVIIPVYNNLELTLKCINSIKKNCKENYEIIVVDDYSIDETKEFFLNQNEVIYIRNHKNRGFAYSCNRGAEASKGEILLFLNNDTLIYKDILEEISKTFEQSEEIGIVGAKLLYPDDTIQHAGVLIFPDKRVSHLFKNFPKDYLDANKLRKLQAITGACLSIKRDLFFEIGNFDERFINGFEDLDLCFRVRQKGKRVIYNPEIELYHFEEKTRVNLKSKNDDINSKLITEKWLSKISPDFFLLEEGYDFKLNEIGEFYLIKRNFNFSFINDTDLFELIYKEPLYFKGYKILISNLLDKKNYDLAINITKRLINFEPTIENFRILESIFRLKGDIKGKNQIKKIINSFETTKIEVKPKIEAIYNYLVEKNNFKVAKYYREWLQSFYKKF